VIVIIIIKGGILLDVWPIVLSIGLLAIYEWIALILTVTFNTPICNVALVRMFITALYTGLSVSLE
jgi:hypothetical protein